MMSVWDFLIANQHFLMLEPFSPINLYNALMFSKEQRNEIISQIFTSIMHAVYLRDFRKNKYQSFFLLEEEDQSKAWMINLKFYIFKLWRNKNIISPDLKKLLVDLNSINFNSKLNFSQKLDIIQGFIYIIYGSNFWNKLVWVTEQHQKFSVTDILFSKEAKFQDNEVNSLIEQRMTNYASAWELGSIKNFADFKKVTYYAYSFDESIVYCRWVNFQNEISWKKIEDLILLNECISGYSNVELKNNLQGYLVYIAKNVKRSKSTGVKLSQSISNKSTKAVSK